MLRVFVATFSECVNTELNRRPAINGKELDDFNFTYLFFEKKKFKTAQSYSYLSDIHESIYMKVKVQIKSVIVENFYGGNLQSYLLIFSIFSM